MEDKKLAVVDDPIREKLRAPFPNEAYKTHDSKSFLTTLKAMYIVERLNDVFGIGRWSIEEQTVIKDDGKYVLMSGCLKIFDYDCLIPTQYGGHAISGTNKEPADGYKSAVTDILSKSASYLEIGIDLFKGKINTQGDGKKKPDGPKKVNTGGMTPEQIKEFYSVWNGKIYKNNTVYWNNEPYQLSDAQIEWLEKQTKFKPYVK